MLDPERVKNPDQVSRYLLAHDCAEVARDWRAFNSSFHVVLTDGTWSKDFTEALRKCPKVKIMRTLWAWDCINTKTLIPPTSYMIKKM